MMHHYDAEDISSELADIESHDCESMGCEDAELSQGGSSEMINNAADLQQEKRNESATHIESTPHIAPSEQASEQEPIIEIVESAVVRNKSSVEAKCFQCGQMSTSFTGGRCKPCGCIKTRMRRLFQKD